MRWQDTKFQGASLTKKNYLCALETRVGKILMD